MNRSMMIIGATAVLIVVGALIIWALRPSWESSHQVSTSDASQSRGTITVGMDSFAGYFILCSPHMRQLMLADGYKHNCVDDKADYEGRFKRLQEGKLDFAVGTVDTYVLMGQRTNYPGTIAAVIDKSTGGDAVVANSKKVKNITDLKSRKGIKVAFTGNSPSHFLMKAIGRDFDVPLFLTEGAWQVKTNGSAEALKKLLAGEVDVAVLWEPDVSAALAKPGMVKLIGSEQTEKLIVDILIVNREFQDAHPDRVKVVLTNYFKALKYYREHHDELKRDVAVYSSTPSARVTEEMAEKMLQGITWVNLQENVRLWFGLAKVSGQAPTYGLIDAVEKTVKILIDVGDANGNPLPGEDPLRIINSGVIAELNTEGIRLGTIQEGETSATGAVDSLTAPFPPLDGVKWTALREVGTLKVRPILFPSGVNLLSLEDKEQLDLAADSLKSYPGYWIEVQGHTRPGGEETENVLLSEERAEAVAQYLKVTYGIDEDRVRAVGFGSAKPLPQKPGESYREHQDNLARVEVHLKGEEY